MTKYQSRNYSIGDIIEGRITGIQPYGIFVQLDENHQGLVHISEISNGYVQDIHQKYQVGDEIRVIIIDIDEYTNKISLSIRALSSKHVDYKPYRGPRHHSHKEPEIGFKTLEEKMPEWIENAFEDIRTGKISEYKMEENHGTHKI